MARFFFILFSLILSQYADAQTAYPKGSGSGNWVPIIEPEYSLRIPSAWDLDTVGKLKPVSSFFETRAFREGFYLGHVKDPANKDGLLLGLDTTLEDLSTGSFILTLDNLGSHKDVGEVSLQAYIKVSLSYWFGRYGMHPSFRMEKLGSVKKGAYAFEKVLFILPHITKSYKGGNMHTDTLYTKMENYYIGAHGRIYTLSFSSKEEHFDALMLPFENSIFNSFKIRL